MAFTKTKWRKCWCTQISGVVVRSVVFFCLSASPVLNSTVLCRLVKANTQHTGPEKKEWSGRGTTTIRTKIGYELWNGRKKSRAINARGMTGFFRWCLTFMYLSSLGFAFVVWSFFVHVSFHFLHPSPIYSERESNIQTHGDDDGNRKYVRGESGGKTKQRSVFHVWLCVQLNVRRFYLPRHPTEKSRSPSDFAANRELSENKSSSGDLSRERHRSARAASKAIEIRRTLFVLTQRL